MENEGKKRRLLLRKMMIEISSPTDDLQQRVARSKRWLAAIANGFVTRKMVEVGLQNGDSKISPSIQQCIKFINGSTAAKFVGPGTASDDDFRSC